MLLCCFSCTPNKSENIIRALNLNGAPLEEKYSLVEALNLNKRKLPYYQAIDTSSFLKKLDLSIEINQLVDATTTKLDTFTLKYMAFACSCPQWLIVDSLPNTNAFNVGFYLKPSSTILELPDIFRAGTVITVIGKVKEPERLGEDKMTKGNVLHYFYYKIHKPYSIWGERVLESYYIDAITDTIKEGYMSRTITVE